MPKKTTQCPRPGLEPGPLAPKSSALTMRPPRLPLKEKPLAMARECLQNGRVFSVMSEEDFKKMSP